MNTSRKTIQNIYEKIAANTAALASVKSSPAYLWTGINLEDVRDILDLFEIPADIGPRIKRTAARPETIKKTITKITHETRALEETIKQGRATPAQAAIAAESLDRQITEVAADIDNFRQDLAGLDEFEQRIKANLGLDKLLDLARSRLSGRRRETFGIGCDIFRTLTEVTEEQSDIPNLSRIYDKVSALIDRVSSRPAPAEIPGLAARIFDHMTNRMINAARDLLEHLRAILAMGREEMTAIRAIRDGCDRVKERDIRERLDFADRSVAAIEKAMSALADRDRITDLVPAVTMLVTQLDFFADCMNELTEQLAGGIQDPARFAAAKTETFFQGIGGLWRLIRLAMTRIGGNGRPLSPPEISAILERLIADCPAFHGHSPQEVERLRHFIETAIGDCQRPFPHDDLVRLGKSAILEYGDYCEASFTGLKLPEEIPVPVGVKKPRAELGQLVALFEKGTKALGKNIQ